MTKRVRSGAAAGNALAHLLRVVNGPEPEPEKRDIINVENPRILTLPQRIERAQRILGGESSRYGAVTIIYDGQAESVDDLVFWGPTTFVDVAMILQDGALRVIREQKRQAAAFAQEAAQRIEEAQTNDE